MPDFDILHPDKHAALKVNPHALISENAQQSDTPLTPQEIATAQKEYVIVFKKNTQTGEFYTCVLLGLANNENLYLHNQAWQANYKPATIARGPFLIGMQEKNGKPYPVVGIDTQHIAVSNDNGTQLFTDNNTPSEFTQNINSLLADLHIGIEQDKKMISAFLVHNLISAFSVTVKRDNQEIVVDKYYSINQESLRDLSAETLFLLNKDNFLQAAFFIAASLKNIEHLAQLKK